MSGGLEARLQPSPVLIANARVVSALSRRSLKQAFRRPQFLAPILIFPTLFLAVNVGGASAQTGIVSLIDTNIAPNTRLYRNRASKGFVLEVTPLVGADERTGEILGQFFSEGMPAGACLQVLNFASPRIGSVTGRAARSSGTGREVP